MMIILLIIFKGFDLCESASGCGGFWRDCFWTDDGFKLSLRWARLCAIGKSIHLPSGRRRQCLQLSNDRLCQWKPRASKFFPQCALSQNRPAFTDLRTTSGKSSRTLPEFDSLASYRVWSAWKFRKRTQRVPKFASSWFKQKSFPVGFQRLVWEQSSFAMDWPKNERNSECRMARIHTSFPARVFGFRWKFLHWIIGSQS